MADIELPNPEELEEIKNQTFTRRVALTTAIFAVILAICSLGGNNAMKEMILAQSRVIFGAALTAAVLGAGLGLNGFLLWFRLPFLSS